jgi:CDP-diacylglycerol--glycerol-3-phosphate 3-phosphatidyltransferase
MRPMAGAAPISSPKARASPVGVVGFWPRIPNALTLGRLLLAAAFFLVLTPWGDAPAQVDFVVSPGQFQKRTLVIAALLFAVAAATDALDGYLARRWNAVTKFGRVMDPFADKVLVLGAFVYLAGPAFLAHSSDQRIIQTTGVAPWMVATIMARELLVTSIRAVLESDGVSFPSTWSGKAKMILQSIVIPLVLGALAFMDVQPGRPGRWFIDGLVWATMTVTVISVWPYVWRAAAAFKDTQPTSPAPPNT